MKFGIVLMSITFNSSILIMALLIEPHIIALYWNLINEDNTYCSVWWLVDFSQSVQSKFGQSWYSFRSRPSTLVEDQTKKLQELSQVIPRSSLSSLVQAFQSHQSILYAKKHPLSVHGIKRLTVTPVPCPLRVLLRPSQNQQGCIRVQASISLIDRHPRER